ncbi:uncharacterized protein N7458_012620 [Penicillium daleae]|uniref:Uncharacterized protein n=1 Tax=Penicillium daleae TaxID=63821 RepID=A0AAD6BXD7_9EURO|nr:uncharacterized protein N7458_012620 [Penicillium daleae]KAJ5433464.1 hypothetical protein N7458_012620 [Penicillium daleae]
MNFYIANISGLTRATALTLVADGGTDGYGEDKTAKEIFWYGAHNAKYGGIHLWVKEFPPDDPRCLKTLPR